MIRVNVICEGQTEESYWEELVKWYRIEMAKFHKAVAPFWDKVQQEKNKQV